MPVSTIQAVLIVNNELKTFVKKLYGKTDEDIRRDVEIINEWWRKQPHLPQLKDDSTTERLLMRNKFRVEQTKKKIDAYFTLKGMYPEFFGNELTDIFSEAIQNCYKSTYAFLLKTPLPEAERILFVKIKNPEAVNSFSALGIFQWYLLMMEIANKYDYCHAIRFVGDLEGFTLGFYKKLDPIVIYKGMKLFQEGFSYRIAGVDYINSPAYVDILVKIFAPLIKDGKIQTHGKMEDYAKTISFVEYLPEEYGGKAGKMQDIQDAWMQEISAHKDYLTERFKCVTDESKRPTKLHGNDDLFGIEGTFKKLNLD